RTSTYSGENLQAGGLADFGDALRLCSLLVGGGDDEERYDEGRRLGKRKKCNGKLLGCLSLEFSDD
ncbi:hypothetical protein SOVF_019990, partial [Spinacia oleracea]